MLIISNSILKIKEASTLNRSLRISDKQRDLLLIFIVLLGLAIALMSLIPLSRQVETVELGEFWIDTLIPITFWVGIGTALLFFIIFLCSNINNLSKNRVIFSFLFLAILLLLTMRSIFPIVFSSILEYAPDTNLYTNILDSWANLGIDFGEEGRYQHDYPLSFLLGYFFIKMGVPLTEFFRWAPFVIYVIDLVLLYLIYRELAFSNKIVFFSLFLFVISPFKYFLTVLYCPNIVGAFFFLLSLYFTLRFVKKGSWGLKEIFPVITSIFLLMLSHHLSIMYFILTMLGLFIASAIVMPPNFKNIQLGFLFSTVYAYTLWFAYGNFIYPSFFNFYSYFEQLTTSTVSTKLMSLTHFDVFSFLIFPIFIIVLFLISGIKNLDIDKSKIAKIPYKLKSVIKKTYLFLPVNRRVFSLAYIAGFMFLFVVIAVGFAFPNLYIDRLLDILFIGIYPVSAKILSDCCHSKSKKTKILLIILLVLVALIDIHRFYREQQRAIIIWYK